MDIFSVDFTQNELSVLRQSLDVISVSGKDAKFIANLQIKLENEIIQIEQMKSQSQQKKIEELQQMVEQEQLKSQSKKES